MRLLLIEMILIFFGNPTGVSKPANKAYPVPRRSPPPPPSSAEPTRNASQPSSKTGGGQGQLGAFWSTQHAKDSVAAEDTTRPKFDEEPTSYSISKHDQYSENHPLPRNATPAKEVNMHTQAVRRNTHSKSHKPGDGPSKDFEIMFSQKDTNHGSERTKPSKSESTSAFQDEAFNTFVAEFDTNKFSSGVSNNKSGKEEALEAEVEKLKEELKQANLDKAEITSKFEKLSAICRSQRQEIQELKQSLGARTPPNKDASKNETVSGIRSATHLVIYSFKFLCYCCNCPNLAVLST